MHTSLTIPLLVSDQPLGTRYIGGPCSHTLSSPSPSDRSWIHCLPLQDPELGPGPAVHVVWRLRVNSAPVQSRVLGACLCQLLVLLKAVGAEKWEESGQAVSFLLRHVYAHFLLDFRSDFTFCVFRRQLLLWLGPKCGENGLNWLSL